MEWAWHADILRHDDIKMNGVTWNLKCEESRHVGVNEDCCNRNREVQMASKGSREGQTGREGDWTTWGYYFLCGNKMKMMLKWEQDFLNHKIILAVKTVCSNPNGVRVTNFATTKDITVQSENTLIGWYIKTFGPRLAKNEVLFPRILTGSEIVWERNLRT